ncbi:MAG: ABC transporter ATP-binding protein [Dissulfurimicrobium sp.]|uniref:ABC transporter ATP-binding protein n=1 Tax=Dissulfurimicrobium sp. TaxID=2022436 RepID=UPI00404A9FC6
MLEVKGLHFRHQHKEPDVLKGVEFNINVGRMTAILGPNGSGKTTLFKCIAGLWRPQKGTILFKGTDMTGLSFGQRARIIAVVPQEHEPPFPYSVMDVVLMGRVSHVSLFSSPSSHDYLKAGEAIEAVGIAHLKERPYTKISGGERQLVLIARALAQETPVLMLDEPTSHLDFRNQVLVLKKVRDIVRQKELTVLMTLHDPNLAMQFSDDVVLINSGHIVAKGAPSEVINEDNLKMIYGIAVSVVSVNDTRVVIPKLKE